MSSPKVWLITGTTSGFGLELTKQALARGDKVIATARDPSRAPEELINSGAHIAKLDVTDTLENLHAIAKELVGVYGQIDYLINNAGYAVMGSIEETTDEDTKNNFNTNVFGLLNVTRAILPHMRARNSGKIVNISSIGGFISLAGNGIYCATKFAVEAISEALATELAPFNIKVVLVEPGYFRTAFLSGPVSAKVPANPIKEYEGTPGRNAVDDLAKYNWNQPGDPIKGCKVIVDVVTGAVTGGELEMWAGMQRIMLGKDTAKYVSVKLEAVKKSIEETEALWSSTDRDDLEQ